ncbi:MAG: trans-aconitate 2-methyltransferase [Bacteroidia bacterium]
MKDDQPEKIWSRLSKLYEEKFFPLSLYDESYNFLIERFKDKSPTILDLGCGPGIISHYLSIRIPDSKVYGIDYSDEMIEIARKRMPGASFKCMNVLEWKGLRNSFNLILIGFLFPYLNKEQIRDLLSKCYLSLEEGGIIYLSFVPGKETDSGPKTGSTGDTLYFNYFETDYIIHNSDILGFKLLKQFTLDYHKENTIEKHCVLIFKK